MEDYFDCRHYDPFYERYSFVFMKDGSALGYKRGLWVLCEGILPYWSSETLGM